MTRRRRLPGLWPLRNLQMRNRESDKAGFWLCPPAGRSFIANLTARPGRGTRVRRDRRRVVVRFYFHDEIRRLFSPAIFPRRASGISQCATSPATTAALSLYAEIRLPEERMSIANHLEQAFLRRLAINDPVSIEYLVATVL